MLLPSVLAGLLHGLWLMASGFYIRPDEYPVYWEWVRLTNPFYRSMSSAMVINLEQLEIASSESEEEGFDGGGGGLGGFGGAAASSAAHSAGAAIGGGYRSGAMSGGWDSWTNLSSSPANGSAYPMAERNLSALLISSGDDELALRGFDGVSVSDNVWLMMCTWLICVTLSFVALELEALHLMRALYRPRAAATCLGGGLAGGAGGGSGHGDVVQGQASTREVVEASLTLYHSSHMSHSPIFPTCLTPFPPVYHRRLSFFAGASRLSLVLRQGDPRPCSARLGRHGRRGCDQHLPLALCEWLRLCRQARQRGRRDAHRVAPARAALFCGAPTATHERACKGPKEAQAANTRSVAWVGAPGEAGAPPSVALGGRAHLATIDRCGEATLQGHEGGR